MKPHTSTILVGITMLLASCASNPLQQTLEMERKQAEWKVCADEFVMLAMVLQMDDAGLMAAELIESECGDGGLDLAARTEHVFGTIMAMDTDSEAFVTDLERRKAALADP